MKGYYFGNNPMGVKTAAQHLKAHCGGAVEETAPGSNNINVNQPFVALLEANAVQAGPFSWDDLMLTLAGKQYFILFYSETPEVRDYVTQRYAGEFAAGRIAYQFEKNDAKTRKAKLAHGFNFLVSILP